MVSFRHERIRYLLLWDVVFTMMVLLSRYSCMSNEPLTGLVVYMIGRFSLCSQVERANFKKRFALKWKARVDKAMDISVRDVKGKFINAERTPMLADQTLAVRPLVLKIGAQVMLIMVRSVWRSVVRARIRSNLLLPEYGTTLPSTSEWSLWDCHRLFDSCWSGAEVGIKVSRPGKDWTVQATDERK